MDEVKEAVRQFKREIITELGSGINVVLSPNTNAEDNVVFNNLPALALQGPDIVLSERNFKINEEKIGETGEGIDINRLKKARTILNLVFRLRLFTNSLQGALDWLNKLACIANTFISLDIPKLSAGIVFSGNNPVNINITGHGLVDGNEIEIRETNDKLSLSRGTYVITKTDDDNFTIPFDGAGAGGTCGVAYGIYGIRNVFIDENFDSDTVPNFSDLKHYEGSAIIENVEAETSLYEDVYASSEGLTIEEEKK